MRDLMSNVKTGLSPCCWMKIWMSELAQNDLNLNRLCVDFFKIVCRSYSSSIR